MQCIDLHCDTLYKSLTQKLPFDSKKMEMRIEDSGIFDRRLQCCAIWLPDDLSEEEAELMFNRSYLRLKDECERLNLYLLGKNDKPYQAFKNNKTSICFTVENSSALNGKIENVKRFADCGVKIMTLTWNGSNSVGDGADINNGKGITDFGRQVIKQMEKYSIIVDISHASDNLFYKVAEISDRPFVATHSNSQTVTPHRRNLTDEQFEIIVKRKGIVGLNFHNAFLNSDKNKADMYDLIRHTEYFLSLGGENTLSLGSDFDGCTLPKGIKNSDSLCDIYEMFLRHNYNEELINRIFYKNALYFFENFDNR